MRKSLWEIIDYRFLAALVLTIAGAVIAHIEWDIKSTDINHKLIALACIAVFIIFASTSLTIITNSIRRFTYPHMGISRATTIQFTLRTIGYIFIALETLSLIDVPIQTLLLGSAVTGIILGVAAQQALANFFASIVLLFARPFRIGQRTLLKAGAFGEYTGVIIDMGLTHTKLELDDGNVVLLPNATVLSSTAIIPLKPDQTITHKKDK